MSVDVSPVNYSDSDSDTCNVSITAERSNKTQFAKFMHWARGYKTFLKLNSAENEICSAYKKNKYQQFKLFSCKTELSLKFSS